MYKQVHDVIISSIHGGKQFSNIEAADKSSIVPVTEIKECVFYINTGNGQEYVVAVPNKLGHCICK